MTRFVGVLLCLACAVAVTTARPVAQARAGQASIQADFLKDWAGQKDMLMKIADAMPEAKYSFKATPPQRDFGQHVMHIAAINVMFLKMLNASAAAPAINDKATSKADVMKAMADSFDYGTAILKEQTDQTMVGTVQGPPFMGPSTRARMIAFLIGHTQDTYGQMAVYLRLNGLVPPASQRP
jgi:uncharacterized damage-inducible protein DinB